MTLPTCAAITAAITYALIAFASGEPNPTAWSLEEANFAAWFGFFAFAAIAIRWGEL